MPQINRIRVNNIKYNFGTQFYDDFLMRFSCRNTIYDLANGGGKSVLMLLLLQTMLPNCTLDEKQPVEKLFAQPGGSTTIHSLVEWKLDSCDVKNGYKYMTCGFCARKARAGEDAEGEQKTGIEYFNYCIFYREFGDNDIKNLPLSDGRERITYNGLKAYLRDLEKKDFGVKVRLFERKGDYLSFINDYGIYESHWELVRGINKTEGHVRTYFESNYRTTRKVVEDLLIEEIIEKSYNNRIRGGNGDDEMSKTLLEIKDKLLELAKRRETMDNYDKEIKLISDFSTKVADFGNIFERKEEGKNRLFKYLLMAQAQTKKNEAQAQKLAADIAGIRQAQLEEERLISAALIADEEAELRKVRALVDSLSESYEQAEKSFDKKKEELELSYAAEDYADYVRQERSLAELKQYIDNRSRGREDLAKELEGLAAAKHAYMAEELSVTGHSLSETEAELQESTEALDNLRENYRMSDNECARIDGELAGYRRQVKELEGELAGKLKATPLLVTENAPAEAERYGENIAALKEALAALGDEQAKLKLKSDSDINEHAQTTAQLQICSNNIEKLEKELAEAKDRERELAALAKVYGEPDTDNLLRSLGGIYDRILSQREQLKNKKSETQGYISAIENLKPVDSDGVKRMCEYLSSRYEGSVVSGAEYLREKTSDECAALAARFPYLPYSVLAGEDYDSICRDRNVMAMDCGVVPIIRLSAVEALLENDNEPAVPQDDDNYMLACRDLSFIYDEAGRQAGIRKASEELEQINAELVKLENRYEAVKSDYERVSGYACTPLKNTSELELLLAGQRSELEHLGSRLERLADINEGAKERSLQISGQRSELERKLSESIEIRDNLEDIVRLSERLAEYLQEIKKSEADKESAVKARRLSKELCESRERAFKELENKRNILQETIAKIKKTWERYAPYYKEQAGTEAQQEEVNVTADEIDAKFNAIYSLITDELGDIADKEKLMANCTAAMEKAERSMLYRGVSLERAKELDSRGLLKEKSNAQINAMADEQEKLRQNMKNLQGELDAASTQMNRIEGSCEYAKRSYEEQYGEYMPVKINNPQEYAGQHKAELSRLKKELSRLSGLEKDNLKEQTACMVMQKDLERMVRTAAPDADDIISRMTTEGADEGSVSDEKLTNEMYEEAGRAFDGVLKEEQKKRTAFTRARDILVDELMSLNAYELAQEVKQNVLPPQTQEEAAALTDALGTTKDCIELERGRISRGIEDMELIKSNFENRCVQICTNIRSELERLDKLSRITLDEEAIPVLSLQIPYVKEEMYKDRMSVYINETVSLAEGFRTMDERLKFIRGRLCWKRLFSVIVTDMDSIRLSLYKRERIKDQSRYLRYEEAVGSTGQSQGIYIQFLVSVINYIASINAGGKEAAVLGKTIFIDNPFGAAKDIYIWEPIFKLLKTNHVQLIVPARGVTPAITGRFDVNYVLGQRLVDKKQQTVVVDYHSQVAESELEYERLTFSQESFDFL